MKKLFWFLIVLAIGCANVVHAEYFDLSNLNKRNYDFNMPKIQTPKFETPKFESYDVNVRKMRNLQARGNRKLKKMTRVNFLVNKHNYKKGCGLDGKMLMTSCENVNIDVEKIPFGNEISVYRISDINPEKTNGNPGGRGINQLIVYTPDYGLKTNTNEYGKEAIIVGNRVVAMSAMDSIIPSDGIVISGHGKAKEWIEKNVILGSRIDINRTTKTISCIITPDTYVYEAQEKIKEAQEINYYYRRQKYSMLQSDFYIGKANSSLSYARCASKSLDIILAKKYARNSIVYSNRAIACAVPYSAGEFKGVWIRPHDRSPEKVGQILDHLKSIGIDNVFLETYYHGVTIFPSDTMKAHGLISQRPEFAGTDVLRIWLEQAHKRNMKVHVWFQTFYIGNDSVSPIPRLLKSKYPEWLNRQYWSANCPEAQPSKAEHNGYFLDPANPAVQDYLMGILKEIATKYDVDGINIDYIRYPVCSPDNTAEFLSTSWGYTHYAMEEFKKSYGVPPLNIGVNDAAWCKWSDYRMNKVTNFVERLHELKAIRPGMTISAVVFPDKDQSALIKLQDWTRWAQLCYVDAFTPLFLSSNIEFTRKYLRDMVAIKNPKIKIYAGLFEPFTLVEPTVLPQEIKATREENADGVIIFDYAHFTRAYQQVLAIRAFNKNNK